MYLKNLLRGPGDLLSMGFILLFYLLPFATRAFSPSHFPRSVIGTKFRPVQRIKEVDEYALDELRQQQRSDEAWRERQKQRNARWMKDKSTGAKILDPVDLLPGNLGFFGLNAVIPALQQCAPELQWQPDWYGGDPSKGGGVCPPELFQWPLIGLGGGLVSVAIFLSFVGRVERLVLREGGLEKRRVVRTQKESSIVENLKSGGNPFFPSSYAVTLCEDIPPKDRIVLDDTEIMFLPLRLGVLVKSTSSDQQEFFLGLWDTNTLRSLLGQRETAAGFDDNQD